MVPHKFQTKLIPKQVGLKYLFVGTFNPEIEGNDAEYFYGRKNNFFWCIMPHSIGKNCQIDKTPIEWENFCTSNLICITDLIKYLNIYPTKKNINILIKYSDNDLEKFDKKFNTRAIMNLISHNKKTLKGIYFTRSTKQGIKKIWTQWELIISFCKKLNIENDLFIECKTLLTPSLRGTTIKNVLENWRTEISN